MAQVIPSIDLVSLTGKRELQHFALRVQSVVLHWETAEVLSADSACLGHLAAETTDVLSADAVDVMSADSRQASKQAGDGQVVADGGGLGPCWGGLLCPPLNFQHLGAFWNMPDMPDSARQKAVLCGNS